MVHNSKDFGVDPHHKGETDPYRDEDGIIQPEWTIDDDGIPYCKAFSQYDKIVNMDLKERYPHEFERLMRCENCDHYHQNDCFFPKEEIDKIEQDRQRQNLRCALCGAKIDRPWSIIMSYYYKAKFGVHIPVICCMCYASLENNTYVKNTQRRMILFAISLATSIYFIVTYFMTVFIANYLGVLLFILPFSFWGYISFRDLKNIYYLYKGRKYYDQIMKAESSVEQKNRRDELLDDDVDFDREW